jgi:hypothetical protein
LVPLTLNYSGVSVEVMDECEPRSLSPRIVMTAPNIKESARII